MQHYLIKIHKNCKLSKLNYFVCIPLPSPSFSDATVSYIVSLVKSTMSRKPLNILI